MVKTGAVQSLLEQLSQNTLRDSKNDAGDSWKAPGYQVARNRTLSQNIFTMTMVLAYDFQMIKLKPDTPVKEASFVMNPPRGKFETWLVK